MLKILINYDYQYFPFTTASYLEIAAKRRNDLKMYRRGRLEPREADLIINVMPCSKFVSFCSVPTVYWEIDCHLVRGSKPDFYEQANLVYIGQAAYIDFYPRPKTRVLPLACDPVLHSRQKVKKELFDIGFIGNDTYPQRRTLLEQLSLNFDLLRTNTKPGLPYAKALSECKSCFNRSMDRDINMRFFEALSIGRLLFTDYVPGQELFAEADKHYILYKDWADLRKKLTYYLKHENEREALALAGSNHIKRHHTYDHRLNQIIEDIQ